MEVRDGRYQLTLSDFSSLMRVLLLSKKDLCFVINPRVLISGFLFEIFQFYPPPPGQTPAYAKRARTWRVREDCSWPGRTEVRRGPIWSEVGGSMIEWSWWGTSYKKEKEKYPYFWMGTNRFGFFKKNRPLFCECSGGSTEEWGVLVIPFPKWVKTAWCYRRLFALFWETFC